MEGDPGSEAVRPGGLHHDEVGAGVPHPLDLRVGQQLRVRDDDGGVGTIQRAVWVTPAALQADPLDPTKTILVVSGTTGNDRIFIHRAGRDGLKVVINGVSLGVFYPTAGVAIFTQGGDDKVQVTTELWFPLWLDEEAVERLRGRRR